MLELLSGRTHSVVTGVTLIRLPEMDRRQFIETTLVSFTPLSRDDISRYSPRKSLMTRLAHTPFKATPVDISHALKVAISMLLDSPWLDWLKILENSAGPKNTNCSNSHPYQKKKRLDCSRRSCPNFLVSFTSCPASSRCASYCISCAKQRSVRD